MFSDIIKSYDQGRRVTGINAYKETGRTNLINQYAYGYNKVNMKTFEQRGHDNNKGDIYSYDSIRRLTSVKFNSPDPTNPNSTFETEKSYQMDKVENFRKIIENKQGGIQEALTAMDTTQAKLNQYSQFDGWTLSYDAKGNTTQKGTQHFTYDYNGRLIKIEDAGNPTVEYGYDALGRRYDKETNLYYYRARYLDPIMGRFLQTDPMGYRDSMNLYQAFNQNPVNYLDPLGREIIVEDCGLLARAHELTRALYLEYLGPDNDYEKVCRSEVKVYLEDGSSTLKSAIGQFFPIGPNGEPTVMVNVDYVIDNF